nr:hypothetical protein CFP56_69123 [Quercus suber]
MVVSSQYNKPDVGVGHFLLDGNSEKARIQPSCTRKMTCRCPARTQSPRPSLTGQSTSSRSPRGFFILRGRLWTGYILVVDAMNATAEFQTSTIKGSATSDKSDHHISQSILQYSSKANIRADCLACWNTLHFRHYDDEHLRAVLARSADDRRPAWSHYRLSTVSCLRCCIAERSGPPFWVAFKSPGYRLLIASLFSMFMSFFYSLSTFPRTPSLKASSPTPDSYFLVLDNAASTFGRIVPGALADKQRLQHRKYQHGHRHSLLDSSLVDCRPDSQIRRSRCRPWNHRLWSGDPVHSYGERPAGFQDMHGHGNRCRGLCGFDRATGVMYAA